MNLAVILLLGPPVLAVMLFHFSYALTTPDMHRTHHSQDPAETNINYGGLFSIWDRLFGNYVDAPALGHEGMAIGLPEFSGPEHNRIDMMLLNPFLNGSIEAGAYSKNRPVVTATGTQHESRC
jgi:fatty acid hydroxylase family protein